MKRYITEKRLEEYQEYLYEQEKSSATIRKYMCDIKKLQIFFGSRELSKKGMVEYKEMLKSSKKYQISSINSFLTASNCFFEYMGWYELKVKIFPIQKRTFVPEHKNLTKREYQRLVRAAERWVTTVLLRLRVLKTESVENKARSVVIAFLGLLLFRKQ